MDYTLSKPFFLAHDAWEAVCVRCDGSLVGSESDLKAKLCGICVTGPVTEPIMPPIQKYLGRKAYDMDDADQVVVEMLINGYVVPGQGHWPERWAAATYLMRMRPDLGRRQIAERVGVTLKTIERLCSREYQRALRKPVREDAVEALMSGRHNRVTPSSQETGEAIRRLIRQGAPDRAIVKAIGCTVSMVSGHRLRMRRSGEFSLIDGR